MPDRPVELIWASPRELFNLYQAATVGCHIITATRQMLAKLAFVGKDLFQLSLETLHIFYDATAGYAVGVHS